MKTLIEIRNNQQSIIQPLLFMSTLLRPRREGRAMCTCVVCRYIVYRRVNMKPHRNDFLLILFTAKFSWCERTCHTILKNTLVFLFLHFVRVINSPQNSHKVSHEYSIRFWHPTLLQNRHSRGPNVLTFVIRIGTLWETDIGWSRSR